LVFERRRLRGSSGALREPRRPVAGCRRVTRKTLSFAAALALLVGGCGESSDPARSEQQGNSPSVNSAPDEPYDGIRADETLRFTGTEPFWGGGVTGSTLTYSTPENQEGTAIEVERFAGLGGISFSGQFEGKDFDMTVTSLACGDGMSDRSYPFTVTLKIGDDTRNGCGWTERQPFEGQENP
jgi:uncharacterized membrane protein